MQEIPYIYLPDIRRLAIHLTGHAQLPLQESLCCCNNWVTSIEISSEWHISQ